MSVVGFEPTIPLFERAKTIYALSSTATVIGIYYLGWLHQEYPDGWDKKYE
jgi:hypothetical protein